MVDKITGYGKIKLTGSDNEETSVTIHAGNNITISESDGGQFQINSADAPTPPASNEYALEFSGVAGSNGAGAFYLKKTNNNPGNLTPFI